MSECPLRADGGSRRRRRGFLLASSALLAAAPLEFFAQPRTPVYRIGFLGAASPASWAKEVEALRAGLRSHGYEEGKNLVIEFRWAEGNYARFPELVGDLIRLKVDVIVTHATPGTLAAKRATATVPIVVAHVGDAVATGIVPSLARPGGNITGTSFFSPALSAKRLELLRETMPRATQIAVLVNPGTPITGPDLEVMGGTARLLNMVLHPFEAREAAELPGAFEAMTRKRVDALNVTQDGMLNANTKTIADLAMKSRLPAVGFKQLAEAGGLIGYGVDFIEVYRRAGFFIDRILKGARPADIPLEQPTRFELVINRASARALGITVPREILARADRVIE